MRDQELLRYSRHILLPELDLAGQERLLASQVLIVGLGGLGSPVALYLAASGVGTLHLADPDRVDLSNLQRQIAHGEADLHTPKVESAARAIERINRDTRVIRHQGCLEGEALEEAVAAADLVADCSDNFATRFALNAACIRWRKPLVSGAAIGLQGQLAVYDCRRRGSPCYACLYPEGGDDEALRCVESGVLAPLVGVIGATQALEAVKCLTGMGTPACGRLLTLDALTLRWREHRLRPDPECPVCAGVARGENHG